ncbi:aminopeptidase N isoform X2 [Hermetia illucens]|nr:aminopeptidase N isoform X2 [Hermetia illucens]
MDGGYINEGGQLKTKNGQKYVVNQQPEGVFVSRTCGILTGIIALCVLIIAILLTYFLSSSGESCSLSRSTLNQTNTAGLFGSIFTTDSTNGIYQDEAYKLHNKEIKLHEGWSPEMYKLIIEPNIEKSTANGSVSINIVKDQHIEGIPPIILDVHNVTVEDVSVTNNNDKDATPLKITTSYGDFNDSFIIKIGSKLDDVQHVNLTVNLKFRSELSSTLQGFYKTSYEDAATGKPIWVASTQFSPIDARRAFPCIDRPDKKAKFDISLVRNIENTMGLSNMPNAITSFYRPGYVIDKFETSPEMSTYLVAFIVSNMVSSNYSEIDKRYAPRVEIWTRPEVTDMTKYAYTVTRKVLPFFENYFGIPFKLPKIDMVAVPDFGFSAMENWGLITFRDSALLVPEGEAQSSSASHKEYVSSIIAHELAHQWFGNLVTPKWWDDLWLKEGFATYMSYLAINNFEPEWKLLETFTIREFNQAMSKDSDKSSHPISFPVTSAIDIRRIFDPISYAKGAILLRMLNSFLGDDAFVGAIKEYLRRFEYSNAIQDDLWKVMTEHGLKYKTLPENMTIKEIMDSWILQPSYPVVFVKKLGNGIEVNQERYLLPHKDIEDETLWNIPITYQIDGDEASENIYWLQNKSAKIPLIFDSSPDSRVVVNVNRNGYYRVNYDYSLWIALKKNFKLLPDITKAQLLDDSLHLARAEYLTYDIPLTFLLEMRGHVENHLLWAAGYNGLQYINDMLNREPAYESFRAYMKFIVRPAFDHYTLDEPDSGDELTLTHHSRVVELACNYNYDRCTNAAQLKYREWMRDPKNNPIKPNFKQTIYCVALREGSFQEWYFAYSRYKDTMSASEKEQILSSLGCTIRPWLLSKYLNMTIDPESGIRKQDGARAFLAVARNSIGYEIAFDFLMTNIKEISEYFGDGFSTLSKMVDALTTFMNKEYHREQFEKFALKARKLGLGAIERSIFLANEQVKNNIYWRSRSYYSLKGFLEDFINEFHVNLY